MVSKVTRVDEDLKKEIKQVQEEVNRETGEWIGEAKALNIILGRERR